MADRTLEIRLTGDVSNFSGAVNKGSADLEKMSGHLGTIKKLAVGAALFEGFQKAADFLGDATRAAEKDELAMTKDGVAVKNAGENWKKLKAPIDDALVKMSDASGFMKDDLATAFSKLELATGNHTKALKLENDAMNIAAQTGKPLQGIALALGKAYDGNAAALKRVGIIVPTVTTAQDKLKVAHEKLIASGAKLTVAQKQAYKDALDAAKADDKQATATSALDSAHKKFADGVSDRTQTMAGKMLVFNAQWENTKVKVGNVILPLLTQGMGLVVKAMDFLGTNKSVQALFADISKAGAQLAAWIRTNWPEIQADIQKAMVAIVGAWNNDLHPALVQIMAVTKVLVGFIEDNWGTVQKIIDGAMKGIQGVIDVVMGLITGDWGRAWNGIKEIVSGAFDEITGVLQLAVAGLSAIAGAIGSAIWNALTNAIDDLGSTVAGYMGDIGSAITGAVGGLGTDATNAGNAIWNAITGIVSGLGAKIGGYLSDAASAITGAVGGIGTVATTFGNAIWNGITNVVSGLGTKIDGYLSDAATAITGAVKGIGNVATTFGGAIWDGIDGAVKGIAGDIGGYISDVPGKIRDFIDNVGTAATDLGAKIVSSAVAGVGNIVNKIGNVIGDIPGGITDWLERVGSAALRLGQRIASSVVNGIGDLASQVADAVSSAAKGAANSVIDHLNSALEFSFDISVLGVGKKIQIDPPDIPHLAAGGIATSATLALIGERGPEAVIPLSQAGRRGFGGFAGMTVNIYQQPGETSDALMQRLNLAIRTG